MTDKIRMDKHKESYSQYVKERNDDDYPILEFNYSDYAKFIFTYYH